MLTPSRNLVCTLAVLAIAPTQGAAMPVAEQNALVKKYCAVCHSEAAKNGGLSLEHYDAGRRDPALAAMMLSKLNNGAMGAAGVRIPEEPVRRAWIEATREQAAGSGEWFVGREAGAVWASIVREVAPRQRAGSPDAPVYRLRVECRPESGVGEMMLTWSPEPVTGRAMTVTVDEGAPEEFRVEGREKMGNGSKGETGRASAVLLLSGGGLPKRRLTVRELFPGEAVEFPFAGLGEPARAELGRCRF